MEVSDTRRLQKLKFGNAPLKKLLADAMLDNAVLQDIAAKRRRGLGLRRLGLLRGAGAAAVAANGPCRSAPVKHAQARIAAPTGKTALALTALEG